jgi:hypothetical protein
MTNRTLARRLEDLEAEFLPVVAEPTVLRVDFVERGGTVVDYKEFTIKAAAPQPRRTRPWRRK